MLIGYARVSTDDQTLDLQCDALKEAGCERIFEDTAGGAGECPNLEQALSHLRAGDTLVVWRLDRLGRSLKDLIARAEELRRGDVGLKSLKEAIDTDSPTGQLVFHIFGALAEFERALIRERTQAGLQAARARGSTGSTPETAQCPATSERGEAVPATPAHGEGNLLADGNIADNAVRLRRGAVQAGMTRVTSASRSGTARRTPDEPRGGVDAGTE